MASLLASGRQHVMQSIFARPPVNGGTEDGWYDVNGANFSTPPTGVGEVLSGPLSPLPLPVLKANESLWLVEVSVNEGIAGTPWAVTLADRLWHCSGLTISAAQQGTPQAVNSLTLPRYADGQGVRAFLATAATEAGASVAVQAELSVVATNNSAATLTFNPLPAGLSNGWDMGNTLISAGNQFTRGVPTGIKSATNFTYLGSAGGNASPNFTAGLCLYRPLAYASRRALANNGMAGWGHNRWPRFPPTRICRGSDASLPCLFPIVTRWAASSSTRVIHWRFVIIEE